jgi:uncharacterized protein (TIGR02271 family)
MMLKAGMRVDVGTWVAKGRVVFPGKELRGEARQRGIVARAAVFCWRSEVKWSFVMSQQVVGFFDTYAQAQKVAAELWAAGFSKNSVHVFGRDAAAGTTTSEATASHDDESLWQRIKAFFGFADEKEQAVYCEAYRRGHVAVAVDTQSEAETSRVAEVMRRNGAIDLESQSQRWRAEGWTPRASRSQQNAAAQAPARPQPRADQATRTDQAARAANAEGVIPVVKEELQVGKRTVETGGVRVFSRVQQRPVTEELELRQEHIEVERRPVNRPANPGEKAFEERAIEVKEIREEPVVKKDARVVEEVVVKKGVETHKETVKDTVRDTEVKVEKLQGKEGGGK